MTVQEMEHRVTAVEDRAKSNTYRLDDIERRQGEMEELVTNVALIAQKQDAMERDIGEMRDDVRVLAEKPGKRWESIVDKILLAAVGILVAFIAVKLGFG